MAAHGQPQKSTLAGPSCPLASALAAYFAIVRSPSHASRERALTRPSIRNQKPRARRVFCNWRRGRDSPNTSCVRPCGRTPCDQVRSRRICRTLGVSLYVNWLRTHHVQIVPNSNASLSQVDGATCHIAAISYADSRGFAADKHQNLPKHDGTEPTIHFPCLLRLRSPSRLPTTLISQSHNSY